MKSILLVIALLLGQTAWAAVGPTGGGGGVSTILTNVTDLSTDNITLTTGGAPNTLAGFDSNTNLVTATQDMLGILRRLSATNVWTAVSAGSNYVADLNAPALFFNMTTNINLLHSTNGVSNFVAYTVMYREHLVMNGSGTNFTISWPATWMAEGSWTNGFTLTNGDWCDIAVRWMGANTSQTNNTIAIGYRTF